MFTGIIESLGTVTAMEKDGSNVHFTFSSSISNELKIDQSVAHNGVCLTVVAIGDGTHTVTAIDETMQKSCLADLHVNAVINLERCMPANGRFDGHIVQGHVDQVGDVKSIEEKDGSWVFTISHSKGENFTVNKGSICVNGVSLTCFDSTETEFSVAIIPYTYEHTCFHRLQVGHPVNLEFDIVGKYVARMLEKRGV